MEGREPGYRLRSKTKGEDDRAVAVYVTFPCDPKAAILTEELLRPVIELVRRPDTLSRMLSYVWGGFVWGGFGKPCEVVKNLFFGGVSAILLEVSLQVMCTLDVAIHRVEFGAA